MEKQWEGAIAPAAAARTVLSSSSLDLVEGQRLRSGHHPLMGSGIQLVKRNRNTLDMRRTFKRGFQAMELNIPPGRTQNVFSN